MQWDVPIFNFNVGVANIWRRCGLSITNILNKVGGILCVHVHCPCKNSPHPKAP